MADPVGSGSPDIPPPEAAQSAYSEEGELFAVPGDQRDSLMVVLCDDGITPSTRGKVRALFSFGALQHKFTALGKKIEQCQGQIQEVLDKGHSPYKGSASQSPTKTAEEDLDEEERTDPEVTVDPVGKRQNRPSIQW